MNEHWLLVIICVMLRKMHVLFSYSDQQLYPKPIYLFIYLFLMNEHWLLVMICVMLRKMHVFFSYSDQQL